MSVTLSSLRTSILQRCDMENSNFASSAELNSYINDSIEELYEILVMRYEDYYIENVEFTIASGDDGYTIPNAIYKLRGVDYKSGSDWLNVDKFNFEERNRGQQHLLLSSIYADMKYRMIGSSIKIVPADQAPGDYRVWYIPRFTELANDSDTLSVELAPYKEFVIVDTAIKLLTKEESDVSVFAQQKAVMVMRINNASSNRDAGQAETITSVRNRNLTTDGWIWDR